MIATYEYDAWGNLLSIKNEYNVDITNSTGYFANINPIRYRGYYYDTETGFYYLKSRYYDPANCRFISADDSDFVDVVASTQATNLFAYCGNDPVNNADHDGHFWDTVFDVLSLASSVVEVVKNPKDPMNWVGLVADTVDLIPFVSGVGEVTKAVATTKKVAEAVDDAHDAVKTADNIKDASETVTKFGKSASNVSACFVAGIPVKTEYGLISIEQVKAGDLVWASDPETGDVSLKQVVQTFVNESDELIHVFVNGEEIITTPEHPFYSPIKGWTSAAHLHAGDVLVLVNGSYVVVEKVQHELLESPITVYNFEVEDYHTYYVGETGVLVHNACGGRNQLRRNMLKNGPAPGPNYQAHHGLPWKHQEYFSNAGIDVNDARFGRWVIGGGNGGHQSWSRRYEKLWDNYVFNHPNANADDIIDYFNKLNGIR